MLIIIRLRKIVYSESEKKSQSYKRNCTYLKKDIFSFKFLTDPLPQYTLKQFYNTYTRCKKIISHVEFFRLNLFDRIAPGWIKIGKENTGEPNHVKVILY
jgi:hypothetical protein